jgi:16S rRNA (uracil1498-N3)-methyltransferase
MNRFFVSPESINGTQVDFPDEIADQIRLVLRLKEEDQVCVLDNSGKAYRVSLRYASGKNPFGEIIGEMPVEAEPLIPVISFIPLTKREKFEWMLQKCTEVGASCIVPTISERCLIREVKDLDSKMERWQKIVREAAEQSGRGILPSVEMPLDFSQAVKAPAPNTLKLLFWEEEKDLPIYRVYRSLGEKPNSITIMTGPEGGFSSEEAALAKQNGWHIVTLGKRILRAETAALAALLLTIYESERDEI